MIGFYGASPVNLEEDLLVLLDQSDSLVVKIGWDFQPVFGDGYDAASAAEKVREILGVKS